MYETLIFYTEFTDPDSAYARAERRDGYLNSEELAASKDALSECILGPNWWRRAHP